MARLRQLLAVLATSTAITGQTFTSPKGYDSVEGNGSHGYVLATTNGMRWQQIDATLRGPALSNLTSIAFRRDAGLATNAVYGSRTLTQLGVVLAHSRLATIRTNFAANYLGAPTTVFAPKTVNTPDWSTKPASAPAPFDLKLTFDQKWSYNGTDDFLWEVTVATAGPATTELVNYPFDFQSAAGSFANSLQGTQIGTGCIGKGQTTQRFVLGTTAFDYGTSFALRYSANYGPRDAATVAFLDVVDANQTVTGLCAVLHALPTVVLPMGTSSSNGGLPSTRVEDIPFVAAAIGQSVYMQAVALDDSKQGIQVALSQGEKVTLPGVPTLPVVARIHTQSVFGGSAVQGPFAGGVIAQFGY